MQAIEGFRSDSSKKVLLASLESFGMGVDLTCACQVILVAPSRNLAVRAGRLLATGCSLQHMYVGDPAECSQVWLQLVSRSCTGCLLVPACCCCAR